MDVTEVRLENAADVARFMKSFADQCRKPEDRDRLVSLGSLAPFAESLVVLAAEIEALGNRKTRDDQRT